MPDLYQGDECVTLSLVDPDNRRPVDFAARRALLSALRHGAAPADPDARKLALVGALLDLRARRPETFASGAYTPLDAGPDALAFLRGDAVFVSMPVRERGRALDPPPGDWRSACPSLAGITVFETAKKL